MESLQRFLIFWIWCSQHFKWHPLKRFRPFRRKRPFSALWRGYEEMNASERNFELQNWFIETYRVVWSYLYSITSFSPGPWIVFDITLLWWKCKHPKKKDFLMIRRNSFPIKDGVHSLMSKHTEFFITCDIFYSEKGFYGPTGSIMCQVVLIEWEIIMIIKNSSHL